MTTDLPLGLLHFNHRVLAGGEIAWTTPGTGDHNTNYGDMLVCAALVRQLAPTPTERVMFGERLTTPVRASLLRGSTYLSRRFDYASAIATIESTDAPVAAVGLGTQAPVEDVGFLDDVPDARRFVAVLSERSASISARGDFTAAVLERLGATDIRLTGCPSMFYGLTAPRVALPPTLAGAGRRLGVSLHTGLHRSRFCRNVAATLRQQSRAIEFALGSASSTALFEQGVLREYVVGDPTRPLAERLTAATQILERFPSSSTLQPKDLIDHLVSVRSVEDWLTRAGGLDAMIGFRFHGNMVGLTQGVPCYYFVYDSRITEFCRLYRLPHQPVEDAWRDPVVQILEHDWDGTTDAIQGCFRELRSFYEENDIAHTLRPEDAPMPPLTLAPDQRPHVVLHVGMGKTGTSSIQAWLHRNRERLAERGILYPSTPGKRRHLRLGLSLQPLDEGPGTSVDWRRQQVTTPRELRPLFERELGKELAAGLPLLLLSDEALFSATDEGLRNLRELLDGIAASVRVVVYLRRQDDHLCSRYQQVVKRAGEVRRLDAWAQALDFSRKYDYHARLCAWRDLVAPDVLVVRAFESDRFSGGSLQRDFLEATGLELTPADLEDGPTRNESLDAEAAEFLRLYNLLRRDRPGDVVGLPPHNRIVTRLERASRGPVLTLPEERLERFMAHYGEANRAVARTFLPDGPDTLFGSPRKTRNTTAEQHLDPGRVHALCELVALPVELRDPLHRIAVREAATFS